MQNQFAFTAIAVAGATLFSPGTLLADVNGLSTPTLANEQKVFIGNSTVYIPLSYKVLGYGPFYFNGVNAGFQGGQPDQIFIQQPTSSGDIVFGLVGIVENQAVTVSWVTIHVTSIPNATLPTIQTLQNLGNNPTKHGFPIRTHTGGILGVRG